MSENLQNKIRLKDFEIDSIQKAFKAIFLPSDQLWIFGSRIDMHGHGGDIDLYVETTLTADKLFDLQMKLINAICDEIGDQKIDVIINTVNNSLSLPIYKKARNEGIKLV